MSMTATAAIASRTTTRPIGALIKYAQIAKAVQMTKQTLQAIAAM